MILGIDIGGSHITAALINRQTMELIPGSVVRRHVHSKGAADEILNDWTAAIRETYAGNASAGLPIGIAMPGPFDYEHGISLIHGVDKYESLYEVNIAEELALRLGMQAGDIRFRNDAEAFLLGEMVSGAGRGFRRGIGITLGTGLGSAVAVDAVARDAARYCAPLHDSFAEAFISTRWFVKRYQERTGMPVADVRELAGRIDTEPVVADIFREFSRNLALFLRSFIADEQPEVVVIGGNIAHAWDLFYPELAAALAPELQTVTIRKAQLGEEAALVGAACCWLPEGFTPAS